MMGAARLELAFESGIDGPVDSLGYHYLARVLRRRSHVAPYRNNGEQGGQPDPNPDKVHNHLRILVSRERGGADPGAS